jgi:hypothetical protein
MKFTELKQLFKRTLKGKYQALRSMKWYQLNYDIQIKKRQDPYTKRNVINCQENFDRMQNQYNQLCLELIDIKNQIRYLKTKPEIYEIILKDGYIEVNQKTGCNCYVGVTAGKILHIINRNRKTTIDDRVLELSVQQAIELYEELKI